MRKEKTAGGITAGLMLIGIGVLAFTEGWWPGIMVVIGVAVIAGMLYRGQFLSTLPIALIFFGIPAVIELGLSWKTYVPLLLIGLGLISLVDNLARYRRRGVTEAAGGSTHRFEYRSGFWPTILIGVGTIWLSGNQGYIPEFNPLALVSLWPLLLIGAGLDLLFGRRSFWIGALIGLAMLAAAAVLLFTRSDLLPRMELKSAEFSEPLGQATSAELFLELNGGQNQLSALEQAEYLVEASMQYLGTVTFSVTGDQAKQIELTQSSLPFAPFIGPILAEQSSEVGVNSAIPIDITLKNSGGEARLNLQDLHLAGLEFRISGGSVTSSLPAAVETLRTDINQSGGDLTIQMQPETASDFRVVISGGDLLLDIPDSVAVKVEVVSRSGGEVNLPENFVQTQTGDDEEGIWEMPGITQGEPPIVITVDSISGGDFTVR